MKQFDRKLRALAEREKTEIPYAARKRIASVLASLPERSVPALRRRYPSAGRAALAAACLALCTLVVLPNLSPAYAQAAERIPVIGSLIRVVTIRNYFYEDARHELTVAVPFVKTEGAGEINCEIDAWTSELVRQFYDELEITGENGYGSVAVEYEPLTDTETWFTLKLTVHETAAGSSTYFKYYHIDKRTGGTVTFGELFADNSGRDLLAEEIRRQMRERMEEDEDAVFWLDEPDPEMNFGADSLDDHQNFCFASTGELVIPFDKYEVAPGYMGCPSFTIPPEVTERVLKAEYTAVP